MIIHQIFFLYAVLGSNIAIPGFSYKIAPSNVTNKFLNKLGLNEVYSHFRNIMDGHELVSGFDMLRGLYLLQRRYSYLQIDPEQALQHNIQRGSIQRELPPDTPFPCDLSNARSITTPKTVHELRPGDIDIIAVMGDSTSAGNCVITTSFTQISSENRGITFSGGGRDNWRRFLTLPNILKVYNPNLYGYSIADGLAIDATSRLNIAEPTLMSRDLIFHANVLIRRMRNDPKVNMQHHWKVLTLFIGNVDLCGDLCFYDDVGIPLRRHEQDLIETLRLLRDSIPRLLVNLLTPPNAVSTFNNMKHIPLPCAIIHRLFCGCVVNATYSDADRAAYEEKIQLWHDLDAHIATLPEFQTDDFAVVFQPFSARPNPPLRSNGETDLRFFASDCFHFSQLSHASMANSLWNNMIQPVGQKQLDFSLPFERFECPTEERPYIATIKNSQRSLRKYYRYD